MVAVPCSAGGNRAAVAEPATLRISEDVVYYRVQGDSEEELREQLRHDMLPDAAGSSHGRTRSDIEIRYEAVDNEGNGCTLSDLRIELRITTTLPEWIPEGDVVPELQVRWDRALAALERHESVHREHALEAARDLEERISQLGSRPDCRVLRRAVDLAFQRVTMKCEFRDSLLDSRTRKGLAERAVF